MKISEIRIHWIFDPLFLPWMCMYIQRSWVVQDHHLLQLRVVLGCIKGIDGLGGSKLLVFQFKIHLTNIVLFVWIISLFRVYFGLVWLLHCVDLKAGLDLYIALRNSNPNTHQFGIRAFGCGGRKIKKRLVHPVCDFTVCLVRNLCISFCRRRISSNPFRAIKVSVLTLSSWKKNWISRCVQNLAQVFAQTAETASWKFKILICGS